MYKKQYEGIEKNKNMATHRHEKSSGREIKLNVQ